MTAFERLDKLPAARWARLREGVRKCQLRRGAWYPVLSHGPDEVVIVMRHQSVILPRSYLEIVNTPPGKWTVIFGEGYAVCPNCAQRVALGTPPESMGCVQCHRIFEFEPHHEYSAL